jgi:hypothetical protein
VSSSLPFVPMSVESFGRLGAPALTLLGDLADQAVQAGWPGLSQAAFISGALRELSIALSLGLSHAPCVGLGCLVRLRCALHSFAVWRVCAIAPSYVSGWRAFSSVSLCQSVFLFPPRSGVALCRGNASLGRSGLSGLCVLCGLRLFVFGLGSLPFGAHAVRRVPHPSL